MPASWCCGWAEEVVDGGGGARHRGGIELMLPALTGLGEVEGMHFYTQHGRYKGNQQADTVRMDLDKV